MAIRRPRRIFRPSLASAAPRGRGLGLWAAAAAALGFVALIVGASGLIRGQATAEQTRIAGPAIADRIVATASDVAVVAADTLRLHDRIVRLMGVTAPARGEPCRAKDGGAVDCGVAATNALADLVRQRPVACEVRASDGLGRPLVVCEASGTDINLAIVATGWARAGSMLPALKSAEGSARAAQRGIWATRESW